MHSIAFEGKNLLGILSFVAILGAGFSNEAETSKLRLIHWMRDNADWLLAPKLTPEQPESLPIWWPKRTDANLAGIPEASPPSWIKDGFMVPTFAVLPQQADGATMVDQFSVWRGNRHHWEPISPEIRIHLADGSSNDPGIQDFYGATRAQILQAWLRLCSKLQHQSAEGVIQSSFWWQFIFEPDLQAGSDQTARYRPAWLSVSFWQNMADEIVAHRASVSGQTANNHKISAEIRAFQWFAISGWHKVLSASEQIYKELVIGKIPVQSLNHATDGSSANIAVPALSGSSAPIQSLGVSHPQVPETSQNAQSADSTTSTTTIFLQHTKPGPLNTVVAQDAAAVNHVPLDLKSTEQAVGSDSALSSGMQLASQAAASSSQQVIVEPGPVASNMASIQTVRTAQPLLGMTQGQETAVSLGNIDTHTTISEQAGGQNAGGVHHHRTIIVVGDNNRLSSDVGRRKSRRRNNGRVISQVLEDQAVADDLTVSEEHSNTNQGKLPSVADWLTQQQVPGPDGKCGGHWFWQPSIGVSSPTTTPESSLWRWQPLNCVLPTHDDSSFFNTGASIRQDLTGQQASRTISQPSTIHVHVNVHQPRHGSIIAETPPVAAVAQTSDRIESARRAVESVKSNTISAFADTTAVQQQMVKTSTDTIPLLPPPMPAVPYPAVSKVITTSAVEQLKAIPAEIGSQTSAVVSSKTKAEVVQAAKSSAANKVAAGRRSNAETAQSLAAKSNISANQAAVTKAILASATDSAKKVFTERIENKPPPPFSPETFSDACGDYVKLLIVHPNGNEEVWTNVNPKCGGSSQPPTLVSSTGPQSQSNTRNVSQRQAVDQAIAQRAVPLSSFLGVPPMSAALKQNQNQATSPLIGLTGFLKPSTTAGGQQFPNAQNMFTSNGQNLFQQQRPAGTVKPPNSFRWTPTNFAAGGLTGNTQNFQPQQIPFSSPPNWNNNANFPSQILQPQQTQVSNPSNWNTNANFPKTAGSTVQAPTAQSNKFQPVTRLPAELKAIVSKSFSNYGQRPPTGIASNNYGNQGFQQQGIPPSVARTGANYLPTGSLGSQRDWQPGRTFSPAAASFPNQQQNNGGRFQAAPYSGPATGGFGNLSGFKPNAFGSVSQPNPVANFGSLKPQVGFGNASSNGPGSFFGSPPAISGRVNGPRNSSPLGSGLPMGSALPSLSNSGPLAARGGSGTLGSPLPSGPARSGSPLGLGSGASKLPSGGSGAMPGQQMPVQRNGASASPARTSSNGGGAQQPAGEPKKEKISLLEVHPGNDKNQEELFKEELDDGAPMDRILKDVWKHVPEKYRKAAKDAKSFFHT